MANNIWRRIKEEKDLILGKNYIFYSDIDNRMSMPKTFLQTSGYDNDHICWTTLIVWNFTHYKEYVPPEPPKKKNTTKNLNS